jgi:creatinine amidohydrolase/Fe(II)-dependent formamide hydrolase-like protein
MPKVFLPEMSFCRSGGYPRPGEAGRYPHGQQRRPRAAPAPESGCGLLDLCVLPGRGTALSPGPGHPDPGGGTLAPAPGVPGSITLRVETHIRVLTDYCRSLMGYGIRRFAIVNGHGNNVAVNAQAARRIAEELGVKVASFAYWEAIDAEEIGKINEGRHYPGHADEFETSMILHICPEVTRMDRVGEIEERYGLHGPGPEVPPGHQFLATTTFQQKGLRERLLCDVATDNYKLASAEKGAQFAALAIQGTAAYLQDFIDHVPVEE